jgi:hypothetical protein
MGRMCVRLAVMQSVGLLLVKKGSNSWFVATTRDRGKNLYLLDSYNEVVESIELFFVIFIK